MRIPPSNSDYLKGALVSAFATAALSVVGAGLSHMIGFSAHAFEAGAVGGAIAGSLLTALLAGNLPRQPGTGKLALSILGGSMLTSAGSIFLALR